MQILFDVFLYNDEFYEKVQAGIAPEECDYEKDCITEKILINVIDFPFKDYIQLVPHQYAKVAKQRWAN